MMSNKNIFIAMFLTFTMLIIHPCLPILNIHQVCNLDLLEKEIPKLNEQSLVIFDIDDTLLCSLNRFGYIRNKKTKIKLEPYCKQIAKVIGVEKYNTLIKQGRSTRELVDTDALRIIDLIKKQGAKVCALTKNFPGECYGRTCNEAYLFSLLESFKIDFSSSFPEHQPIFMQESSDKVPSPMFYKGILLTSFYEKGDTLVRFLGRIKWWPTKIIMIDDLNYNLRDVGFNAIDYGIDFLGLHYVAVQDMSADIDSNVVQFQMDYLIEHERWLNAQEAKELKKE